MMIETARDGGKLTVYLKGRMDLNAAAKAED